MRNRFNDTASNVVRAVDRLGQSFAQKIILYPEAELDYAGVDSSKVARQGFARGLCVIDDQCVAVGRCGGKFALNDYCF